MFVDEAVLWLAPDEAYGRLRQVIETDPALPGSWYARWWASDTRVLVGDLGQAIVEYPPPTGWRATMQVERLLSLKVAAGQPYSAMDLLALAGPKITRYGREHYAQVTQAAQAVVAASTPALRAEQLQEWARQAPRSSYQVFIGSGAGHHLAGTLPVDMVHFAAVPQCLAAGQELARTAENMVREESGIPGVGQGWVSETQLFVEIRDAFAGHEVQQHASPAWLGRQHLDVYLPGIGVALEFQSLQHDQPVAFFGGQEAFEATLRRDARKRQLCRRHGVRLIYVRPGYDLSSVVAEISSVADRRMSRKKASSSGQYVPGEGI